MRKLDTVITDRYGHLANWFENKGVNKGVNEEVNEGVKDAYFVAGEAALGGSMGLPGRVPVWDLVNNTWRFDNETS